MGRMIDRGTWIPTKEQWYFDGKSFPVTQLRSSICNDVQQLRSNFCPNCGADMRKKKNVRKSTAECCENCDLDAEMYEDVRKSAESYCENCIHVEVCRWYPYEGCEWLQEAITPGGE